MSDTVNRADVASAIQAHVNDDYDRAELSRAVAALPAATGWQDIATAPTLAADILGREMQAIIAADRWKGRSLTAEPPEKWARLRPETRQFWTDEARRILARIADEADRGSSAGMDPDYAARWRAGLGND